MTPKKQTKIERIRELERQIVEHQAQQIHNYHIAHGLPMQVVNAGQ